MSMPRLVALSSLSLLRIRLTPLTALLVYIYHTSPPRLYNSSGSTSRNTRTIPGVGTPGAIRLARLR